MKNINTLSILGALLVSGLSGCGGDESPQSSAESYCDLVAAECGFVSDRAGCEGVVRRTIEEAEEDRAACGAAWQSLFQCNSGVRCGDFDFEVSGLPFSTDCEDEIDLLDDEC